MTNIKNMNFISLIVLAAINLIVFYPSFYNCAKADHIVYLVETAEMESLPELIGYSYSYCRTRVLLSGDRVLFRPIFYIVLSIEKWLWGYNFIYWQLTGFFLHLIILALFIKLLKIIRPDPILILFALFFSMQYISCDLVTWHHMHGYLLFLIFILFSLIDFTLYIQSRQVDAKKLWRMVLFLFLACFTNEFGSIVSLIIMLALLAHRRFVLRPSSMTVNNNRSGASFLNKPFLLLFLPVSYLYVSILDYTLRFSENGIAGSLANINVSIPAVKFLYQFIALLLTSFILPFSPGIFMIVPDEKNYAILLSWTNLKYLNPYNKAVFMANLLLLILILTAIGFSIYAHIKRRALNVGASDPERKKRTQDCFTVMFLCAVILMSYISVFVFFRTSGNSLRYISSNLYHFYIMTLITAVIGYGLFSWLCDAIEGRQAVFRRLIIIVLCLGALLNGLKVYQLNRQGREAFSLWGNYIMELENFVNAHKKEADFSFFSITRNVGKATIIRMGDASEGRELKGYISDYFFRKYIDVHTPKYYLIYTRKEGIIAFNSKEEAEQYLDFNEMSRKLRGRAAKQYSEGIT